MHLTKKILATGFSFAAFLAPGIAQETTLQSANNAGQAVRQVTPTAQTAKYGYMSFSGVLQSMPEYISAMTRYNELRGKYEAEVQYNETTFRQMFADFLQGQKDFPQNIMLKRQRGLQEEMEKSLAFRHEADSLLAKAKEAFLATANNMLSNAIKAVGQERGYETIVNTDQKAYLYMKPELSEDATPFVLAKLKNVKP